MYNIDKQKNINMNINNKVLHNMFKSFHKVISKINMFHIQIKVIL